MRRAKTGRQKYVSLLTHMSVFPFLYGDANDRGREAFEVQRLVPNYRAPDRDEEDRRPWNCTWLAVSDRRSSKSQVLIIKLLLYYFSYHCFP